MDNNIDHDAPVSGITPLDDVMTVAKLQLANRAKQLVKETKNAINRIETNGEVTQDNAAVLAAWNTIWDHMQVMGFERLEVKW